LACRAFETGVVVMPLVKGAPGDTPENPEGRIRNTHKLLTTAALIMSVLLLASSVVTTLLIPADAFARRRRRSRRAKRAGARWPTWPTKNSAAPSGPHTTFSTVLILWFAGASAMAGLLNIVPRYLPRYGMSPEWTRAGAAARINFHRHLLSGHGAFQGQRGRAGGGVRDRRAGLMTSATVAVPSRLRAKV
jgi:hypothetical protein